MITDKTLLNVFGVSGMNSRYIQDACRLNDINVSNYTDADFRIGASINIMGRNIIIHDCDSFTREFYRLKYNLDMEPLKCETKCYAPKLDMEETIPAHDGIGSAEDSYSSCISLIPKPPQKDFIKFLTLDKNGLESYTLRFNCLLDNVDNTDNKDRRFIISFHLSDDTVEIHQMVGSNSGIQGGRFLQRRKINRFEPKETKTLKDERDYLISQDFYVGARLKIFSHCFLINDADQYTYKYMEENKSKYPKANSNLVLEKLQKIVKLNIVNEKISEACLCSKLVYSLSDINDVKTVAITAIEVKSWLSQKKLDLIDTISAHELITLFREFSNKEKQQKNDYYKDFCLKDIQMYIKSELKNLDYTEYDLIVRYIRNIYESCIITKEELLKTLKACRLPINMDKLNSLCDKYVMEMGPEIDVEEFLKSINWCLDMSNEFGNENDFTPKINNKSIILINEIIEAIFIKKP
ncbi:hypothetical protein A3Q56_00509 [Intoshia linei]|uniref:DM10 domain-containing protein n=1 Tax=Intoshia linei TaxID=1819745 RepID=A0A177BDD1_9BILA|nr:hypothetical protein A3Q56_00509 [Intoshia linei]